MTARISLRLSYLNFVALICVPSQDAHFYSFVLYNSNIPIIFTSMFFRGMVVHLEYFRSLTNEF